MSVPQLLDEMAGKLRGAGIVSPRREARLLLSHALGLPPDSLVLTGAPAGLEQHAATALLKSLKRRLAHEPLAYILGRKEFWSLDFIVGPGVLVPRPESETLVEEALRIHPDPDDALEVLDLGTGSGCLLLAFLAERQNTRGVGVDISPDALRYARANADRLGFAQRTTFREGDWGVGLPYTFDLIFINPPYVSDAELANASRELHAEPRGALAAGTDGLDAYRALAPQLAALMKPKGHALIEIGAGQADAVSRIFSAAGLETERLVPDLSCIHRCLVLVGS